MIDAAEKKYGLIGDGTGDNAEAFRKLNDEAAASGQAIRLPPGRYRTSPFGLSSGVALVGESDRNTIIDLYPDTPDGPMVSVDSAERVRLGGITFTAEHCAQGRSQSLVSFAFANRCLFEHCSIVQARGPALTIAYGKHNTARYSYFSGTGPVNGMALWIGNTADAFAVDTVIDHCIFEGVHGCVLVDAGIGTKFANNHISNQMEAAIFTLPSARDYKYLDNTIDTVRGSPAHTDGSYDGASSSGMEIGGWGGLIRGNTIRSTQNGGIDIQSAGDLIVVDNHIYLPGYPRDVRWPLPGAITYLSMNPTASESAPGQRLRDPRNVQICRNIFDGSEHARLILWRQEGAPKLNELIIADNMGIVKGGLMIDAGTKGKNCYTARNLIATPTPPGASV